MLILNLNNVEELIFYDPNIKKILPEFADLVTQWSFAKQNVGFRQLVKRSIIAFLDQLTDTHLDILSKYFGQKIAIDKLDHHIVKHVDVFIDDAELGINTDGFEFAMHRKDGMLHITFWR